MSNPEVQPTRRNPTSIRKEHLTPEEIEIVRARRRLYYQKNQDKIKKQYQENKEQLREKYRTMDPQVKHEKSEEARRNRYVHKHGSLVGFVARIYGEAKVYKTPGYRMVREALREHYKSLSPEEKAKRIERAKRSVYKQKHGTLEGYPPIKSGKSVK